MMTGEKDYHSARNVLWITTTRDDKKNGDQPPQYRRLSKFAVLLQEELRQAIEQAHDSTRMLQSTIATLEQQIHHCGGIVEQWRSNGREKDHEIERCQDQCRTLAEEVQDVSVRLDEIQCDRQNLLEENAYLKTKLEQSRKELNGWKEDCMFFAVKLMNWGPSLLKWGPALHHEFERRLLQRRKKNSNMILLDRKLKSNIAVGSSRSTFVDKSEAAVAVYNRHRVLPKNYNPDDKEASDSCTSELCSSKKSESVS